MAQDRVLHLCVFIHPIFMLWASFFYAQQIGETKTPQYILFPFLLNLHDTIRYNRMYRDELTI